jgi:hypothetical protein
MTSVLWRQATPDTGELVADTGRVLARYVYSAEKNHPHFRNVRPVEHDGVLSNSAPWDHRWHHGLWWSWKFINDVLYWEDHPDFGGARGHGLGRTVVMKHDVEARDGGIIISEQLEWVENDTGRRVLTESRTMTVAAVDGTGSWHIDWDQSWQSDHAARLDTTAYPENWWGGYAGLNFRAGRSLASGEVILAAGGLNGREAVHGAVATWSALFGRADGSGQDDPDHPSVGGIAILRHPGNAQGPSPTYVFSGSDEFGFLASAPLMHHDLTITPGETLRLRHRTIVFGRSATSDELDNLFAAYSFE